MYEHLDIAVKKCAPCNALKPHQQKEKMQIHEVPKLPWTHVSSDIIEFEDKHHLITVDSYSGWYEIDYLKDIRSATVIAKLKKIFSTHGSPYKLTTDNGRQYTSEQFQKFVCDWDIQHITSSPTYPQSNGLAEREYDLLRNC